MLFHQFETKGLAHYSYLIGCQKVGVAAIVDPKRDIDTYIQFARSHGLKITKVLETHIHADYASGALELAHATQAEICLSAYDKGELFEVKFAHSELKHADFVEIGNIKLKVLHTPGHTPEHISFLVFDGSRSSNLPMMLLSGDFIFVGSVGRPDLLGEDAKMALVEKLYKSCNAVTELPDGLEIYPAHGAGSMCGAGLSAMPHSTLGYERACNPYLLKELTLPSFREKVFAATPPFPEYYKRMKRINSEGPKILDGLPGRNPLTAQEFKSLMDSGALVIDLRDQQNYGAAHIANSFGIGLGNSLATWASWLVPYDTPILLVLPGDQALEEGIRHLIRVGLDDIKGYLQGGIDAWKQAGLTTQSTEQISAKDLAQELRLNKFDVLDVRAASEYSTKNIPGSIHCVLHDLPGRTQEFKNRSKTLALICGSGYRSTIAASLLERAGIDKVTNVSGGMIAWMKAF